MFSSLKGWLNVPVTIKPMLSRSASGTKIFGDSFEAFCYPVGNVQQVVDSFGAEVVSTTQLYFDSTVHIKVTDVIVFEGEARAIHRINSFYRNGAIDCLVVYL